MRVVFSILFFLTLGLPPVLEVVIPSWHISLGGVTKEKSLPLPTWQNIASGKFQSRFEKWFTRKLGVRPFLVKTDNQINYELFSQLSSSKKGKAILGRDGHLVERIYIKRAQGALAPKKKKLQAVIKDLKRFHKVLNDHGIPLLVLISPNKPSFYPEVIPWSYKVPKSLLSDYETLPYFSGLLEEAKIPFIESKSVLKEQQNKFSYPFFAHTGTHWSELGSCLIASKLFASMRKLVPHFSGTLQCETDGEREKPLPIDKDLLTVANLWTSNRLYRPSPIVIRHTAKNEFKPSVLFVGTSYLWALFYNLDKANLLSKRDMYYYFKRSVPYPRGKEQSIDRNDPKWIKRALTHDLIVLEVNEAFLHRIGYGFPKQFLKTVRKLQL